MAGEHPSEPTLLEYVENELGEVERATVEAHLAECSACAADVALVRGGAEALAAAPELEVAATTRARIDRALPRQSAPRVAVRHRWVRVALPVAAALALVGGVTTLAVVDGGGGDDSGAAGEAGLAEESASDAGGGSDQAEGGEAAPSQAPVRTLREVAVDARELVRELERRGFDARLEDDAVVVRTERKRALERYLAQFPKGPVEVRVE